VKLAVAASPEVAIPALDFLLSSKHDLALIISRPDSAVGRGRELTPTPVSKWALEHDIELYRPDKSINFDNRLSTFDLVITIGYGLILPQSLLIQPKYGFVNVHFSLLPLLRGAAPAQRAIIEGFTETGITIFQLDPGMDTGPIFFQQSYPITSFHNSGELLRELADLAPAGIEQTLDLIESGYIPVPQELSLATYAAKLSKAEAQIDWSADAAKVTRHVLGFAPNPGATTKLRGDIVRITNVQMADIELEIGEIRLFEKSLYVGCNKGSVEILEVTPSGKRPMSGFDWANGARFTAGEKLE
jgi:methionyl-tRNA formyltransferase